MNDMKDLPEIPEDEPIYNNYLEFTEPEDMPPNKFHNVIFTDELCVAFDNEKIEVRARHDSDTGDVIGLRIFNVLDTENNRIEALAVIAAHNPAQDPIEEGKDAGFERFRTYMRQACNNDNFLRWLKQKLVDVPPA